MIAIKFIKNRKSYIIIESIPPNLNSALSKNPSLIKEPETIYNYFHAQNNITNISSEKNGDKKSPKHAKKQQVQ